MLHDTGAARFESMLNAGTQTCEDLVVVVAERERADGHHLRDGAEAENLRRDITVSSLSTCANSRCSKYHRLGVSHAPSRLLLKVFLTCCRRQA